MDRFRRRCDPGVVSGGGSAWIAVRHFRAVLASGGSIIFGQRDPAGRRPGRAPGGGTHSGGQVPPYVPYNQEWDPKRRIRWTTLLHRRTQGSAKLKRSVGLRRVP